MRFFVGMDDLAQAKHLKSCFISVNRLRSRKRDFQVEDWIMDCAGFTELFRFGAYRTSAEDYAEQIKRWKRCGNLLAAVSQDYMCEPWILQKTGLSVCEHQRLTIERYMRLVAADTGVYIMPVLQGYQPKEYVSHIGQYGDWLKPGMWVGVGSVCKRNANPASILDVLLTIKAERPDLGLHGFGLKTTALAQPSIRDCLRSADSMSWSFTARREGRNAHDVREAVHFEKRMAKVPPQRSIFEILYSERSLF
jgi:hypothetical protein